VSDDESGHARSLVEQLRIAEENGNLPDELARDQEEDNEEEKDDVE
jgi:hypothetical protein